MIKNKVRYLTFIGVFFLSTLLLFIPAAADEEAAQLPVKTAVAEELSDISSELEELRMENIDKEQAAQAFENVDLKERGDIFVPEAQMVSLEEVNAAIEQAEVEAEAARIAEEQAAAEEAQRQAEAQAQMEAEAAQTEVVVEETPVETPAYSDEFMTICSVVEAETHGADMESKMRIACVIRNRVNDSRFPSSYYGVCTQANQFASRWDIEQSTIDAVNAAFNGGDITGGALWFCTCGSGCWASQNATYLFTDSVGHHFWC